jgi:hypothetical protein
VELVSVPAPVRANPARASVEAAGGGGGARPLPFSIGELGGGPARHGARVPIRGGTAYNGALSMMQLFLVRY